MCIVCPLTSSPQPGSEWVIRDDRNRERRYKSLQSVINDGAEFLHLTRACPGSPCVPTRRVCVCVRLCVAYVCLT